MLCQMCQAIPIGLFFGERGPSQDDYFELPVSVKDLRKSTRSGSCELCTLVSDNLCIDQNDQTRNLEMDSWSTCSNDDEMPRGGGIRVKISGHYLYFVGMKKGSARRGKLLFDMNGTTKPTAVNPHSEECIQKLATWIKDCVQNHRHCRPLVVSDEYFLPTRLLDVGSRESEFDSIRLILTSQLHSETNAKYLALSHCWGNAIPQSATTTMATLDSHLEAIPIHSLTDNFKDVCFIARKLGVKYVWIDSLCIIQDSIEDWTRESGLMGKIFSRSYCAIGAGQWQPQHDIDVLSQQYQNNYSGFLAARPPRATAMVVLEEPEQPSGRLGIRNLVKGMIKGAGRGKERRASHSIRRRVGIFPTFPTWNETYSRCSLSERGWTLQERELSVRSVFYTSKEMIWECQSRHATERLPMFRTSSEHQRGLLFPLSPDRDVNFSKWYAMVENYTKRKLSHPSDKLPAISGLAEAFEEASGITGYVAGLWEEDLIEGLLWSVASEDDTTSVVETRPPSWSWASVDGAITWWTRSFLKDWSTKNALQAKPSVISLEIVPSGSDPRGRLSLASLKVNGVLRRLTGQWPKSRKLYGTSVAVNERVDYDYLISRETQIRLFVLVIYLGTKPAGGILRNSFGILLTPTRQENTYRRLGLVSGLQPKDYLPLQKQDIVLV